VKSTIVLIIAVCSFYTGNAQYLFSGYAEDDSNNSTAYLSIIDDYRKISGVHEEQIISKVKVDTNFFKFKGNNLDLKNKMYRIHIDNCNEFDKNHFNGKCDTSREIIFIANNNDTINLPISLNNQMFCDIQSSNKHSNMFFMIDSLKELMIYDYSTYRSEANRKLNNKKWFNTLQQFGEQLNEPLAELYIYNFLSDRSGDLYSYYLKDVESNDYYEELLVRLNSMYANSSYVEQFESEINSDRFTLENKEKETFDWKYILYLFFGLSILMNIVFWMLLKKAKKNKVVNLSKQLTQQEQKILDLILQNKTNKEIATEIFVSVSTVKTHINNLYKKLNVESREQVKNLFIK